MATLGTTTVDGNVFFTLAGNNTSQVQAANRIGSRFVATESGTITSIHAYLQESGIDVPFGAIDVMWFVNEVDSGGTDIHDEVASGETLGVNLSTAGWFSVNVSGSIVAGKEYIINATANPADLPDNTNNNSIFLGLEVSPDNGYNWKGFTSYALAKENPLTDAESSMTYTTSTYITYTPTTAPTIKGLSTTQGVQSITF